MMAADELAITKGISSHVIHLTNHQYASFSTKIVFNSCNWISNYHQVEKIDFTIHEFIDEKS